MDHAQPKFPVNNVTDEINKFTTNIRLVHSPDRLGSKSPKIVYKFIEYHDILHIIMSNK